MKINIKSKQEIYIMRQNCRALANILQILKKATRPGVSADKLEKLASSLILNYGGKPSFKGFNGYPAALCLSINEEIVHGLPEKTKVIKEGDLVSLDLGIYKDGFHSDAAISFGINPLKKEVKNLLKITKKTLDSAIQQIRPGIKLGKISAFIQKKIENAGLSVIKELTGHGIGRQLHENPTIFNYGSSKKGPLLKEGMTLAIEPMISLGSDRIKKGNDGFVYLTSDGSLSCHFEHTILVTKNGAEVLTKINSSKK